MLIQKFQSKYEFGDIILLNTEQFQYMYAVGPHYKDCHYNIFFMETLNK